MRTLSKCWLLSSIWPSLLHPFGTGFPFLGFGGWGLLRLPSSVLSYCNPGHKGEHVAQSRLSLRPCKSPAGIPSGSQVKLGKLSRQRTGAMSSQEKTRSSTRDIKMEGERRWGHLRACTGQPCGSARPFTAWLHDPSAQLNFHRT